VHSNKEDKVMTLVALERPNPNFGCVNIPADVSWKVGGGEVSGCQCNSARLHVYIAVLLYSKHCKKVHFKKVRCK
jgi:hypothetical protein